MRLSHILLACALLVCAAAHAATGPFPIAEPRIGEAPGRRLRVRAAAGDGQFLLVWQDTRSDVRRTFAARMTRDGAVLDPTGLPLEDAPEDADFLHAVASDGRDFLIAINRFGGLRLVKVTHDGVVVPVPAPGFTGASDGNLVWLGDAYAYFFNGRLAVLDRDGRVLLTPRVAVTASTSVYELSFSISTDGTNGLLRWVDAFDGRVYAAPVTTAQVRNGTLRVTSTPLPERTNTPSYGLAAAASASRHLLVWTEDRTLRGRILTAGGAPAGERFVIAENVAQTATVSWNGSRFVVAYAVFDAVGRALHVAEYDENGTLLATPLRPPTWGSDPQVASLAGDTVVAWHPSQTTGTRKEEVRADILRAGLYLRPAEGIVVTRSLPIHMLPGAVWRGDHYLVVWAEVAMGTGTAVGRLDAQGRPLDGAGRLFPNSFYPAVATDGNGALVAVTGNGLNLLHVSRDGVITPRRIETEAGIPDVTWTGQQYAFCSANIIGTATADGAVARTAPRERPANDCAIEWTGTQYLLFWTESEFCFPICRPPTTVRVQAYSRNLFPIGAPVTLAGTNVDEQVHAVIRVATAGDRTLVVWRTTGGMLRGARIAHPGTILDPLNGFEIGPAATLTGLHVEGENWVAGSGPYTWTVGREGHVSGRLTRYPFISERAEAVTVRDGPSPLVIYQTEPGGSEQVRRLFGRFDVPRKRPTARR